MLHVDENAAKLSFTRDDRHVRCVLFQIPTLLHQLYISGRCLTKLQKNGGLLAFLGTKTLLGSPGVTTRNKRTLRTGL